MGAPLYIVLEKQIPGLDTTVDGKMLSRAEERLAETSARLGVRPLMEFFSMNPEEAGGFLEGEGLEGVVEVPAEQWFLPEEGLRTVQALLGEAEASAELREALQDLQGFSAFFKRRKRTEFDGISPWTFRDSSPECV